MINEYILEIITSILCFLSIFFAIFLFFVKSTNKVGNRILAFFLIVRALDASVIIYDNYIELHPALDVLRHDLGGFLQSPLLFLFMLSIIYKDFKLKAKYILLLIPFLLVTLFSIPRYYLIYLGFENSIFEGLPLYFEILFTYTLASIQNLGLIILTFFILIRYRKIMLENYSVNQTNYRWLFYMNVISSFLFIAALIKNIHKFQDHPPIITELRILVMGISLFFICWLVFKALMAPKLFSGIDSNLQIVKRRDAQIKLEGSTVDRTSLEQINKVQDYIKSKEPYLNPQLTIADLANELGMNVSDLSVLINRDLSKNFHTFINEYRVQKAKELLVDSSKDYTIQEVLYKVGFNSKSSFNVSFKQFTNLTPTQYRSNNL